MRKSSPKAIGDMQDGMLAWYQSQAVASDVNVEARIDRVRFSASRGQSAI
jgi:hypothetical protein